MSGDAAFLASAAVCGLSLFIIGALISIFTSRSALFSGLRMLGIGTLAAIVTYSIGRLLGVSIS
jgi:VIT1/CCC1 family predicted Fe2+/Mn2+ transporter